ncbi:hypothetical protein [Agreia sp. COWG]|uniref:hypothetical protein n=1 Tax=Agreia sp. COWG TaxID=2773266 RepID=UPI001928621F|nr:hypothetical protein [Agreia sp. COWG]CAD6003205.1 conserved protein of unknown function [Agreia sp. COWG]
MPSETNETDSDGRATGIRRVGRRRVKTDAAPGSDPTPQRADGSAVAKADEDTDASWGAPAPRGSDRNDDRLKQEKPPHW